MKKILFTISITFLLNFFSIAVFAQSAEDSIETIAYPTPKWVSEKGYWVAESNIHTPKVNTIYFYNNDNVMVYKENVTRHLVLNLKKTRVKMVLKKVLEQSIMAFDQKQKPTENEMLIMNLVKR